MANNMDLHEMKKMMEQQAYFDDEATKVIGNDWMDGEFSATPNAPKAEPVPATKPYTGPGLVIEPKTNTSDEEDDDMSRKNHPSLTQNTLDNIKAYLDDMDTKIENANAEREAYEEAHGKKDDTSDEYFEEVSGSDKATRASDEFNRKYSEAVVIIDKSGVGRVINFTDEERAKLERAKTIKLNEIENIDLSTFTAKKAKKSDFYKFIKKTKKAYTTNIVLPLSGYTAEIKGLTAYEMISLINDSGENPVTSTQQKWSMIHSHLVSTSLGDMDFDTFIRNTAAMDYNNFIYGLLCSTYPSDDKLPMDCPKCKTSYDHLYTVASLIRVEEFSDKLKDVFSEIVDSSVSEVAAKQCHENSALSTVKTVQLPDSGIIVELYVQSAYDLINVSMKTLSKNRDSKFIESAVLATSIKAAYFQDPDDGEYYTIENPMAICEMVYNLGDTDVLVLRKMAEDMIGGLTINYGFMNVKCPSCGVYTATVPIEPETLLFYRYRQAMSAEIE